MLGKGLESLIPQKGNNNNGGSGQPDLNPADELPAGPVFSELPGVTQPASPSGNPQPAPIVLSPKPAAQAQPVQPEQQPKPAFQSQTEPQPRREPQLQAKREPQKREEIHGSIFHIEVEKIEPNPGQPRRTFDAAALQDLARSIREFGFLQPLVVTKIEKETPTGVDVLYQLIAGERRLMAAKLLGLRVVPAIIRNVNLEREKVELAVIENIQRENLSPIEAARAFQRLQEEFRMTQREIAAKLGKSRETVANTVRLLDLPAYIQESLERGELSESHARLLLVVIDPGAQKKLFDDILHDGLTTRDVKDRVKSMSKPRPYHHRVADENIAPEVKAMQENLSMSLGAPVEIHKGANTGKITITFYSGEELENIMRRLGGKED